MNVSDLVQNANPKAWVREDELTDQAIACGCYGSMGVIIRTLNFTAG
jgi:hypothetical protein